METDNHTVFEKEGSNDDGVKTESPNSHTEGTDPQLVFTKSTLSTDETEQQLELTKPTTQPSIEDRGNVERADTDITTDCLMTEKEIQELDQRIAEVVDQLQKQRHDFEKWEESLNKRRLLAFGRLKALGRFHKQRMEVYDTVKQYLNGIQSNKDTDAKCVDS